MLGGSEAAATNGKSHLFWCVPWRALVWLQLVKVSRLIGVVLVGAHSKLCWQIQEWAGFLWHIWSRRCSLNQCCANSLASCRCVCERVCLCLSACISDVLISDVRMSSWPDVRISDVQISDIHIHVFRFFLLVRSVILHQIAYRHFLTQRGVLGALVYP